jgi:hypothetical protein
MNVQVEKYLDSWFDFQRYCERKAKGRCDLTNNCWRRLKEYHLEDYLTKIKRPFAFIFMVKYQCNDLYNEIPCMNKFYYKYLKKRNDSFNVAMSDYMDSENL